LCIFNRIKELKKEMNQQTEFLKLIVQKMDIKGDDDDNNDQSLDNDKNGRWNSVFKNIRSKGLSSN
jgi:hypothetical protein